MVRSLPVDRDLSACPAVDSVGTVVQRVLFNGRTSASQADDVGSIPITRSKHQKGFADKQGERSS